jgi:hypothetical protein
MLGGRPTTDPRPIYLAVRVAPRHKRMLEARARREGVSVSEALRRILDESIAPKRPHPTRRAKAGGGRAR